MRCKKCGAKINTFSVFGNYKVFKCLVCDSITAYTPFLRRGFNVGGV